MFWNKKESEEDKRMRILLEAKDLFDEELLNLGQATSMLLISLNCNPALRPFSAADIYLFLTGKEFNINNNIKKNIQ